MNINFILAHESAPDVAHETSVSVRDPHAVFPALDKLANECGHPPLAAMHVLSCAYAKFILSRSGEPVVAVLPTHGLQAAVALGV